MERGEKEEKMNKRDSELIRRGAAKAAIKKGEYSRREVWELLDTVPVAVTPAEDDRLLAVYKKDGQEHITAAADAAGEDLMRAANVIAQMALDRLPAEERLTDALWLIRELARNA